MMRQFILILFIFNFSHSFAQDSLICKLDVQSSYFTTDQYQNIYFINAKNEIVKYNVLTKDSITFSNKQLGTPAYIDASNPLKVLVLYPDYSSIVLLDNKFAALSILQFNSPQTENYYKAIAACKEEQGDHIWIYDELSRKIIQLDERGNKINESEVFDQLFDATPDPYQLIASGQKLYLFDHILGVIVFDIFSSYVMTLDLVGDSYAQIIADKIIFISNDQIQYYDLGATGTKSSKIPDPEILQVNFQPGFEYYRTGNAIFTRRR